MDEAEGERIAEDEDRVVWGRRSLTDVEVRVSSKLGPMTFTYSSRGLAWEFRETVRRSVGPALWPAVEAWLNLSFPVVRS